MPAGRQGVAQEGRAPLKDGKFARPEASGIDRLIAGIAMGHRDDESRLERGSAVFDDLYTYFSRKRG